MAKEMTNRQFSKTNKEFIEACQNVGLEPTVRQASKWQMKRGKAWNEGRKAQSLS